MKTGLTAIVAMLVLAVVLGGTGCAKKTRPPATKSIEVPMEEVLKHGAIERDVTLAVGDTLKVTLGSNYTTPFRWAEDTTIGDTTIVKQVSHQYVRPDTDMMGAPGTEVWTFSALKPGSTTIATGYASFVGGDNAPTCTFTAKVIVQ
ncbi:protease inhibitor I42 family protein [Mycobacterium simiae]|uniref:Protease inhibitor I42 family protein n=1 Tax=Mycobacterium simiae TaxID=1784 RepID=A0A5B1BTL3_MYCSI|nr:protease inhibitor I42 family protein [Mycobacterium simiae]KAA1250644.1 protease inhibitor I42 family protein [Mycobacterium simiae]